MTDPRPIGDDDLHGYVDGRLAPERRTAVEAWLATHPERTADVAHWQRQNEALAALFASPVNDPVPARLSAQRILREQSRLRRERWPRLAAAAVVLLAMGGAFGWGANSVVNPRPDEDATLIGGAVAAHALFVKEKRHAVEVAADDREHLVNWLSNRVARPITPPDLAAEGFALVGGRLLPAGHVEDRLGPAAQLMYENGAAERVTVYITAAADGHGEEYKFSREDGLDALYWSNDKITCTVVGDLPADQMKAVARKIYHELTLRPDGEVTGS